MFATRVCPSLVKSGWPARENGLPAQAAERGREDEE
jgi:hypothetical protein